ncbi:MAG: O-antigen ligase family protein [Sedimentisphaerales bacterium]|nr:O-antigen ligase family protein [Sedimentisphaerales bacterium]
MAIKTIIFALGVAASFAVAPFIPLWGLVAYVLHYNIGPEGQWWASPINDLGVRYSLILAVLTAVGMLVNWNKLKFGKSLLTGQEKLLLLFLAIVWLGVFIGGKTVGRYSVVDHPSVKMTKMVVLLLMMTHLVCNYRNLNILLWSMVLGALFLGMEAFDTPRAAFVSGRLETVGGPDFREANRLAGYLAAMMPIIGVKFLRSKWPGKIVSATAGILALNTIVLCRSRSALVGLASGGIFLALIVPRKYRLKIFAALIAALIGFTFLMDPQFIARSKTILRSSEDRDSSAQSRIEIWKAGIRLIKDEPLGVGPGNFTQAIGRYCPEHENRDAHSTFIRCGGELGVIGLGVLLVIIFNALWMYRKLIRRANNLPLEYRSDYQWLGSAMAASLVSLLCFGLTGSLVYFEAYWWYLLLPVCLWRAMDNIEMSIEAKPVVTTIPDDKMKPKKTKRNVSR